MMYKLTITKLIRNPDYEKEAADYRDRERRGNGISYNESPQNGYPSTQSFVNVLDVEVTEEMFSAVRGACLEVM